MGDAYLAYRRAKFATRLPTDRMYTAGHFWLRAASGAEQRIGFTKFATRMLGEVVEFEFEVAVGDAVERGQPIGWFEGFKAVTELYSPVAGRFAGSNPALEQSVAEVHDRPYDVWLYAVAGELPDDRMEPAEYAAFLDGTIDRMMGTGS